MRKIVYYVAVSVDGYISGINDDVADFVMQGSGVDQYFADLKYYDTVIMGRSTYEVDYKFGLKPGQLAYPSMKHYIFSGSLKFENPDPKLVVSKLHLSEIDRIRSESGTDIYLCGGGQLAGCLLENQRIDILKLKLNPLLLGQGVKLFEGTTAKYKLRLVASETFDNGLQIMTYHIHYPSI